MKIVIDKTFDKIPHEERSEVFEVFPDVYEDNRGSFSEVLKDFGEWSENCGYPIWFSNTQWIRQINRSKSTESVVRGCHAQKGIFCQGKLVEAINNVIFDIITDARPNSETFGVSKIYKLNPKTQNKLWVPRGFLHGFITPDQLNGYEAIFNYYVDNTYNKDFEICINPLTLIPKIIENLKGIADNNIGIKEDFKDLLKTCMVMETLVYSEKDKKGLDYTKFMYNIKSQYDNNKKLWYK